MQWTFEQTAKSRVGNRLRLNPYIEGITVFSGNVQIVKKSSQGSSNVQWIGRFFVQSSISLRQSLEGKLVRMVSEV